MSKIILDLCGGTGSWSKFYKEAGYTVRVITLPDFDILLTRLVNGGAWFSGGEKDKDLSLFIPLENVYGILCAPPCTHFAGSGAQYWKEKDADGRTEEALKNIDMCLDIIAHFAPKFWALENPVGRLPKLRGDRLGEVRLKFNPNDYGDPYTKKTYVWGEFNSLEKSPVELTEKQKWECKQNTRKHPELPADYKRDIKMTLTQMKRSITPDGFAEAFYKANP